jgi:cell wall-associated NlpC family hydrolase
VLPEPAPGDVWAVDTGSSLSARLIRVGAVLAGQPGIVNHVVGVHHQDRRGRWWGVEGRPGGVGWADLGRYRRGPLARLGNSNAAQPKTAVQRQAVCAAAAALVGVPYDWAGGIGADALDALGLGDLAGVLDGMWGWRRGGTAPGHVVCSSLYAWVYAKAGLSGPRGERCTPASWWTFNNGLA